MKEHLRAIADLDRVIHEPGRMMIVALLAAVAECDFLYLQRETELNKGNLSSHLAKLEEAGYVEIAKTFQGKVPRTLVRLTAPGRTAFEDYRKRLNAVLAEQLKGPAEQSESAKDSPQANPGMTLQPSPAGA
jgi:DNA-binding MarR family transcriptional regulator